MAASKNSSEMKQAPAALKPLPAHAWNRGAAAHLLNRAAFGGTPGEIDSLAALGPEGAVRSLMGRRNLPDTLPAPAWTQLDLATRAETLRAMRDTTESERQKLQRERQREQRQQGVELVSWWLRRMHQSPDAFREKLALFWHGHFATSSEKVREPLLMWRQNQLFREHGDGEWLNLLDRITRDPAMLIYLDQAQSKMTQPNENYARELLELFALGEGHYTETDVTESARALTGLTLDRLTYEARYNPRKHDAGRKTILGHEGPIDPWQLLQIVAAHCRSAAFITAKLWTFYAGVEPTPAVAAGLVEAFEQHDRAFGPFLEVLFRSEAFYSPDVVQRQIKSPVQLLVQACRQLERDLPPPTVSLQVLKALGQIPFAPPNVKGWDGGTAWINTNTLLHRHNLALMLVTGENSLPALGRGRKGGQRRRGTPALTAGAGGCDLAALLPPSLRSKPEECVAAIEQRFIGRSIHVQDRKALLEFAEAHTPLDDTEAATLLRLALCTPDYQLC